MTSDAKHTHVPLRVHTRALERLNRIHQEIGGGKYPNIKSLAALLERDARTVKRDLREMRDSLKAPIKYCRRRNGFYYESPGWAMPPVTLSEGVLLAFFIAEQILKSSGHTPEAQLLRSSLAKLAAYLPEQVTVNLANLGEALNFQTAPHTEVAPETLKTLAEAAAERRTVRFAYFSQHRNEQTHRAADILLLHNFAGDWYAIAFDHLRRTVLDFNIARIKNLQTTNDFFDPPEGWNKDAYLNRGFSMMRGGRLTTVSILFDSYQARWMRERRMFHPEERREELPDGSLRLSFPVGANGLEAVARFCLAYAGNCVVEKPAALRKIVRERLERALTIQK